MRSDDGSAIFPYTRIRGQVALVGVNTAVPTPPFLASGRIGADQLSRLETQLLALKRQCLFRIVLIHHPITDDACAERKHLSDRLLVRGVLGRAGAELVLHGHTHKTLMQSIAGPTGLIPVLGAPSARSEEHTSELQSLMRISYAVFCLKKKKLLTQHNAQNMPTTYRLYTTII